MEVRTLACLILYIVQCPPFARYRVSGLCLFCDLIHFNDVALSIFTDHINKPARFLTIGGLNFELTLRRQSSILK
jgi:hypothetical protein